MLFGVTVLLYFIKILSGSRNICDVVRLAYNHLRLLTVVKNSNIIMPGVVILTL